MRVCGCIILYMHILADYLADDPDATRNNMEKRICFSI